MSNDEGHHETAEVIAIDEHAALCLAAAETGSRLWKPLVDGTTLEKLVEAISAAYASSVDELAADVDLLLTAFGERGLLQD